jgi:C-terminal processing protease CtpA/Prc
MLDKGVAAGAKAWLFDLRGNTGGYDADYLANYFLTDQPMLRIMGRNGSGGVTSAKTNFTLPPAYQLPIAIIHNDRTGSGPELFAADLRENKRATIVGATSAGCMGEVDIVKMADGSYIAVVISEYVGANTGFKYNNVGVPADVPADDASAVDKAIAVLQAKL